MEHYAHLAKLHGLSVSGVRYRLRTGKPLDCKRSQHRPHKEKGKGPEVLCLDCLRMFAPTGKTNRICPECRAMEYHGARLAEVLE